MASKKGKIAVAMSGGVDSSVAAALLLEEGWDVVGVTLKLHKLGPSAQDAAERAGAVARRLGIRHFFLDGLKDFERLVLRPCWEDLISGRTPAPCTRCNEGIKFGLLLEWALANGCDALGTGHYARLAVDGAECQPRLLRGLDRNKDQTYFLAGLSQAQLSSAAFPLGGHEKPWVRERAKEMGLPCAESQESQDACFALPGLGPQETLRELCGRGDAPKKGRILDWDGRPLAQHDGIHNFTIGQRRGVKVGTGTKAWVKGLDPQTGDVRLTNNEEDLLSSEFTVSGLSWAAPCPPPMPLECEAQVRYRCQPVPATLAGAPNGRLKVRLSRPARAITPGQAAAFYDGDWALGRGWIEGA